MINLGAGFDSTYFRLSKQFDKTLFIDIDFPDVISRKISLIKSNEVLFDFCSDLSLVINTNGNFSMYIANSNFFYFCLNLSIAFLVYSSKKGSYVLIGIDLRDTQMLEAMLKLIEEFDDTAPTLFLSEVVMTYMAVNR